MRAEGVEVPQAPGKLVRPLTAVTVRALFVRGSCLVLTETRELTCPEVPWEDSRLAHVPV